MASCLQCKRVYIAKLYYVVSVGFLKDTLHPIEGAVYEPRRKVTENFNC